MRPYFYSKESFIKKNFSLFKSIEHTGGLLTEIDELMFSRPDTNPENPYVYRASKNEIVDDDHSEKSEL